MRFRGNYEVTRNDALDEFRKSEKREPEFFGDKAASDVQMLLDLTANKSFYSKQRK